MNKLVSIIVPIYNAEKYIEKCIKSLINQTYKNIEIILVNDGSTDNSGNICEKYKKQDSRIVLINKKNAGVSSARNDALKIAKGEYISFVDADDKPEKNMIEEMLTSAVDNNSDIVISEYNYYYEKNNKTVSYKLKDYPNKTFLELISDESTAYGGFPWNKLVRKECIKELYREDIHYYENLIFFLENSKYINNYSVVNKPLYNYCIQESSAVHSKIYSIKRITNLDALDIAIDLVSKDFKDYYKYLYVRNYCDNRVGILDNNLDINLLQKYQKDYIKHSIKVLKSKKLSFITKLKCYFMVHMPKLYNIIFKLLR